MEHASTSTVVQRIRHTVVALMVCSGLASGPAAIHAQDAAPHVREFVPRRIDTIEPRLGPAGTQVLVSSTEMPMITPIWVGIGASRTGFEAFRNLMTDMDGSFALRVAVPDWARWDRVHTFIAFDIYFRPIALSDVFHVTNEDGLVRRSGRIVQPSLGCLGLEDVDGVRYALDGTSAAALRPGDDVALEGRILLESRCGMPHTLVVTRVDRSGPP